MSTAGAPAEASAAVPAARTATFFFDCDDCLYQNNWRTAKLLTQRIDDFCYERMQLEPGRAYELYKTYGTCLRGLLEERIIEGDAAVEEFLAFCHDVDLSDITADDELRSIIQSVAPSVHKYVFTASIREHAQRCLKRLGIEHLFIDIIDCRSTELHTKHSEEAYRLAMARAGVSDPSSCYFVDDSVSNMKAAKAMGWNTCLVGRIQRDTGAPLVCEHADVQVGSLHELRELKEWAHLFSDS